ncbi:MAG: hypothetical protein WCT36_00360 [Candidatus Gracilibacteria bacterium]
MQYMDVTFREATNVDGLHPSETHVLGTLERLKHSGIDYVEPSYIQPPKNGVFSLRDYNDDFIARVAGLFEGTRTKIATMLLPDGFSPGLYSDVFFQNVDMVRLGCNRWDIKQTAKPIDYFKKNGLQVAVSLIRSSQYPADECANAMLEAEGNGADIFYLADTNGTMLPEDVKRRISELRRRTGILLGFHPHDNMGFAEANSLEAMNCGAEFLDGSLLGFGKGAGNARTEKMFVLFERLKKEGYDSKALIPAMRYFFENVYSALPAQAVFTEQYKFILYALHGVTLATDKKLKELARVHGLDELDLAAKLVFQFMGDFDALQSSFNVEGNEQSLTVTT